MVADDGTVYALVTLPTALLREAADREFTRNEGAAFAEFKAGEAVAALDRTLAENPTRSGKSASSNEPSDFSRRPRASGQSDRDCRHASALAPRCCRQPGRRHLHRVGS